MGQTKPNRWVLRGDDIRLRVSRADGTQVEVLLDGDLETGRKIGKLAPWYLYANGTIANRAAVTLERLISGVTDYRKVVRRKKDAAPDDYRRAAIEVLSRSELAIEAYGRRAK